MSHRLSDSFSQFRTSSSLNSENMNPKTPNTFSSPFNRASQSKSSQPNKILKESIIVLDSSDEEACPTLKPPVKRQIIDLDSPEPKCADKSFDSLPSPGQLLKSLSQSQSIPTPKPISRPVTTSVSPPTVSRPIPKEAPVTFQKFVDVPRPSPKKPRVNSEEKAKQAAEKERLKAQKQLEKEHRQREAQRVKEAEQANRRANRVWNKSDTIRQMVIDVDLGFLTMPGGGAMMDSLRELGCRVEPAKLAMDDIILWRRVTQFVPHETEDRFVDLGAPRLFDEPHVLIKFGAYDFAQAIAENSLRTRILPTLRQKCPNRDVLILIFGLTDYYRRKQLGLSAQFKDRVLQTLDPREKGPGKGKATQAAMAMAGLPDRSRVDMELMHLQIVERCKIIETDNMNDFTDWLIALTTEIGLVPYKRWKESVLDFHHGGKAAKVGQNPQDTWKRMLTHIFSIEDCTANAIIATYPTFNNLYSAYKACYSEKQKQELLADIVVQRVGKNGVTQRRVGPTASKRIYEVLMGRDSQASIR